MQTASGERVVLELKRDAIVRELLRMCLGINLLQRCYPVCQGSVLRKFGLDTGTTLDALRDSDDTDIQQALQVIDEIIEELKEDAETFTPQCRVCRRTFKDTGGASNVQNAYGCAEAQNHPRP